MFRELYSEKRVVAEERRSRIDNSPMGRFQEAFLAAAASNNYRRPIIGYELDVAGLGRREVEAFFRERYGPRNLVIAIVGDTTPEKVALTSCALVRLSVLRRQSMLQLAVVNTGILAGTPGVVSHM